MKGESLGEDGMNFSASFHLILFSVGKKRLNSLTNYMEEKVNGENKRERGAYVLDV